MPQPKAVTDAVNRHLFSSILPACSSRMKTLCASYKGGRSSGHRQQPSASVRESWLVLRDRTRHHRSSETTSLPQFQVGRDELVKACIARKVRTPQQSSSAVFSYVLGCETILIVQHLVLDILPNVSIYRSITFLKVSNCKNLRYFDNAVGISKTITIR